MHCLLWVLSFFCTTIVWKIFLIWHEIVSGEAVTSGHFIQRKKEYEYISQVSTSFATFWVTRNVLCNILGANVRIRRIINTVLVTGNDAIRCVPEQCVPKTKSLGRSVPRTERPFDDAALGYCVPWIWRPWPMCPDPGLHWGTWVTWLTQNDSPIYISVMYAWLPPQPDLTYKPA